MNKIGGELGNAYKTVVEADNLLPEIKSQANALIESKDTGGLISYVAEVFKPPDMNKFQLAVVDSM